MEIVSCSVKLAGDNNHVVEKTDVTVAEVVLLQHIHGMDSVVNIRRTGMDRRSHREERERLRSIYNRREKIVDKIFPNLPGAKLPVSLADIDLSMAGGNAADEEESEETLPPITAAQVRRVPAPAPVSAPVPTTIHEVAAVAAGDTPVTAPVDNGAQGSAADVLEG